MKKIHLPVFFCAALSSTLLSQSGLLEQGVIPWQKPWQSGQHMPRNLISKREYRGVNVFLLHATMYESPYWLSFKQASELYTRVSTDKQTDDSQLNELREYCHRRNWSNVVEYRDVISGASISRQALDKLMADVRRGKLDVIVCFKLDRLGRSLPPLAEIVGELTAHRVALVCPSQGIDTSGMNPSSQLQLNILMAIAEFERSIIQERVSTGLRAAKAKGVKLGRPATLNQHAQSVRSLLNEGLGIRAIARRLKLPIASYVRSPRAKQHRNIAGSAVQFNSSVSAMPPTPVRQN